MTNPDAAIWPGSRFTSEKEYSRYINRIIGRGYEAGSMVYQIKSSNGYTFWTRDRGHATWAIQLTGLDNTKITMEVKVKYSPGGPVLPEYMAELFEGSN